jgi:hypothetical protein
MQRIAIAVFGLALGLSTGASAVPDDPGGTGSIVIEQRTPGSLQWDVYAFTAPGASLAEVNVWTTGFTAWEFDLTVANLSLVDSVFRPDAESEVNFLLLNADPGSFAALGGTDDLDGLHLGTYTSALPTRESVALYAHPAYGAVILYDPQGFPYPADEILGVIVPEPGALVLGLLALAALADVRLRPAQHRSR